MFSERFLHYPLPSSGEKAKEVFERQRKFFRTNVTRDLCYRKQMLSQIGNRIVSRRQAIMDACYADSRRPKKETFSDEIQTIQSEIFFFMDHLAQLAAVESKPDTRYGAALVQKEPLGTVLIIGPACFPFLFTLRPAIAAIAAGNTVVIKPSPFSPNAAATMVEIFSDFNLDHFCIVEGGAAIGEFLVMQKFDHILFTGCVDSGREVLAAAAHNMTPVTLELGSKCPCYVDADADLEKAADIIAREKLVNSGQLCITSDYLILHKSIAARFMRILIDKFDDLLHGKAANFESYGRMANEIHWTRVKQLTENTRAELVYTTGESDEIGDEFIAPRIYKLPAEKRDLDPLMAEEIFGPLLPYYEVQSVDQAIDDINDRYSPLSAFIFSENDRCTKQFVKEVHAGSVVANGIMNNYFSHHLPYGGVGQSGMGRINGKYGFDTFSHHKAVMFAWQ